MAGTAEQQHQQGERRDAVPVPPARPPGSDDPGGTGGGGPGRDETETERLDRNWGELLQELRVLETGTQILTGFLLTVAFQQKFSQLNGGQVTLYLVLVSLSALATMLVLAPVSLHRTLFRQGKKGVLVAWTNRLLRISLAIVALTVVGVVVLLFDVATNFGLAVAAGVVAALALGTLWFAIPMSLRRRH
jgi:hypothetical protein